MLRNVICTFNQVVFFVTGIIISDLLNVMLKCDSIDVSMLNKAANNILSADLKSISYISTAVEEGKNEIKSQMIYIISSNYV